MSETKKLLEECKKILAEIKDLIVVLRSMPQEEVLRRMKDLPLKDKAILVDAIRYGEISKQVKSIMEKTPNYIS